MNPLNGKSNRISLVVEFLDIKEQERRELAKKRSPAHDFQRQIKFDPKQHPLLKKEAQFSQWTREFSSVADAQGFAEVLDLTVDRSKMTPEELDLDAARNEVSCPVFQTTLKTPETAAVVLDMAKNVEKSRKTWELAHECFRASVHHQNTKSAMKTDINNHRWSDVQWTGAFTQFVLELERKIKDHNQVAEDDERCDDAKKKDSLKQAILGCPDLISLETF